MQRGKWASWLFCMLIVFTATVVAADEAPITGRVNHIDPASGTLTVEASERGNVRQVTIDIKPETKIVRFARGSDGKIAEQAATLADLRSGWIVTVTTHHHGGREVAQAIRVVHER